MVVREIHEEDYGQVASLYKNFFAVHSIFQKEKEVVESYIRKEDLEREAFLVVEQDGMIKAAGVLVLVGSNKDASHKRWKFRHFAFETETVGRELLLALEKKVHEGSPTGKIELTIAETEEGIDFFKLHGYFQEGILKNHYRWDEICYVLGKSVN